MAADEVGTLARFNALRTEIIDPKITQFKGRVVGSAGDSLLVEFASAVDAVQCAVEVQERIAQRGAEVPEEQRIRFRMGLNLGDVIFEGGTIHGDGVNIAARLEKLAQPGTVVLGRSILEQVKGKLPYAYSDLGEHTVKNIAERLRAFAVVCGIRQRGPAQTPTPSEVLPPPTKPSIAVLPFTNMSGDLRQEYFSDGITEDIITELSRNHGIFVIARNSCFVFKGQAVDVAEVGRRLGVRYIVEGSVRKAGNRIRTTAQLVEASTGAHVWAERYDRELGDLFKVQDEITERIVWAVAGRVGAAEIDRSKRRKQANIDSYDALLRGVESFHRFTERDSKEAVRLFQSAIDLDPQSAEAYAWLAQALFYASVFEADPSRRPLSVLAARRAVELGDDSGRAEAVIAIGCRWNDDFESAEAHMQRAVALGPSTPDVLSALGFLRLWQGQSAEARNIAERLRRLDPLDPGWNDELHACACYLLGDYEACLQSFRRWRNNEHYRAFANLAACLAQLARLDEAKSAWQHCLELKPGFTIEEYKMGSPYRRPEDLARWLDGLAKLGIA